MKKLIDSTSNNQTENQKIFKEVNGKLVEIEKLEPGKLFRTEFNVQTGVARRIQLTDEEEAAAYAQQAAWDAGASEREAEERRIAEEAKKFEDSLQFENRIVAFIDILGWKKAVEDAAKGETDRIKSLGKALAKMQHYSKYADSLRELDHEGENWSGDPIVTQFSDSMLISVNNDERGKSTLERALWALTLSVIQHGLLLRGGVARGKLFHQGTIVFGPALHEAYYLESKVSSNPRIIISNELSAEWSNKRTSEGTIWRRDKDGHYFYNFLPPFYGNPFFLNSAELWKSQLSPIRELILVMAGDTQSCPNDVFEKYEWLAGYFDLVCDENPACGVEKVLREALAIRQQQVG